MLAIVELANRNAMGTRQSQFRQLSKSCYTLKAIREVLDSSQVELAELMGLEKTAICRFESRKELKLGALDEILHALISPTLIWRFPCGSDASGLTLGRKYVPGHGEMGFLAVN